MSDYADRRADVNRREHRLNKRLRDTDELSGITVCGEAADEIERLRGLLRAIANREFDNEEECAWHAAKALSAADQQGEVQK